MTADTQLEIRALVHRYADAVSRGDPERWLACWAPDGRWELFGRTVQGHEALAAFLARATARYEVVVQLVHNGAADLATATGTGCWYITEHARAQSGAISLLIARYDDDYVHHHGTWLFARRTLSVHYSGPAGLPGDLVR